MIMYDYVWLCMIMYDYVWLCMIMYVSLLSIDIGVKSQTQLLKWNLPCYSHSKPQLRPKTNSPQPRTHKRQATRLQTLWCHWGWSARLEVVAVHLHAVHLKGVKLVKLKCPQESWKILYFEWSPPRHYFVIVSDLSSGNLYRAHIF